MGSPGGLVVCGTFDFVRGAGLVVTMVVVLIGGKYFLEEARFFSLFVLGASRPPTALRSIYYLEEI